MNRRIPAFLALSLTLCGALAGEPAPPDATVTAAPPQAKAAVAQYMSGPSVFIQNQGQWDAPEILFALDGTGANVGLTERGPKFQLFRKAATSFTAKDAEPSVKDTAPPVEMHAFSLIFDGAVPVKPAGRGLSESTFNYTVGPPDRHREGVLSFNAVWYEGLYPGVDLEMTGRRSGVKYNFHVAPGADWKVIRLRYDNIQGLSLRPDGALEIRVRDGWEALADGAPHIYQEVGGAKKAVDGQFVLFDDHTYGFEVSGAFDATLPLVIDPLLEWNVTLGAHTPDDTCGGVAVAADGSVYTVGTTSTSGWVSGGWDAILNRGGAGTDGFLAKHTASGDHVWSTYIGGAGEDTASDVAVDGAGNVYVTGRTDSVWASGGWDTTPTGFDAYLVKFSASGAHAWSTYIGNADTGDGVAVDGAGNVYVAGTTRAVEVWVSGGWDTTPGNSDLTPDGFLVKFAPEGAHLWSTYLGGANQDYARAVAVDGEGSVYAVGDTTSNGWVLGGWDTTLNGPSDAFLVKFSASGTHQWSTYAGGGEGESAYGLAVAADGLYIAGTTYSPGWAVNGWDTTFNGAYDAFLAKLSASGEPLWSTYLGGGREDQILGVAVDGMGSVYAAGWKGVLKYQDTQYGPVPYTEGDSYLVKMTASGEHCWTLAPEYGGNQAVRDAALDGSGGIYCAGQSETYSLSGVFAGFLEKWTDDGPVPGNLRVTIEPPEAVAAGAQWRRAGTSTWRNSGDTDTGVMPGGRVVEFRQVSGWMPPEDSTVVIDSGAATETTGIYAATFDTLSWSTYLGGVGDESGQGVAVDAAGYVYATGDTASAGWAAGGWDGALDGAKDAYVVKLSPTGGHEWSSYLGGAGNDTGQAIAVDDGGNVCVTGMTDSAGWAAGGWDTVLNGGSATYTDGYVVKLSPEGAHLWSTYLGGSVRDVGNGLAVDGEGNIIAAGTTSSGSWVSGGWDSSFGSSHDGYVVKLSPSGGHLWSSYIGGSGTDYGWAVAVDAEGDVFAAGESAASGWVSGGWDTSQNGHYDAFVVKLSAAGQHLWSTYLGGADYEIGYGLAVEVSGAVYVTGYNHSPGWVSGGWNTDAGGGVDAFVAKLSSSGAHEWSASIGGMGTDVGRAVTVDGVGNVWAAGWTESTGWVNGGWKTRIDGVSDGYVVKMSPSGAHLWSTLLGGSGADVIMGVAADPVAGVFVAGQTASSGWMRDGWDTSFGGDHDGFVARVLDAPEATGGITVAIAPPDVVAAGARWRRMNTPLWHESGFTETNVPAGVWNIEFLDLSHWSPPDGQSVAVSPAGSATLEAVYADAPADLAWSSYVGGAGYDTVSGVAADGDGNVFATGETNSTGWMGAGAFTNYLGGFRDAYVTKLSPTGAHLWSAYIGGGNDDRGADVAVGGDGSVYATGFTQSGLWTLRGWDTLLNGGSDGYLVKFTADGTLSWSTYIGGASSDTGQGVVVGGEDSEEYVYVTGNTLSDTWVSRGADPDPNGQDAFLVKLSGAGQHVWSCYLGGSETEEGTDVAVDGDGNVITTGQTNSPHWAGGGWDAVQEGYEAYVVKFAPSGPVLWSTYLGGGGDDSGTGVAVDGDGNVYATGNTGASGAWVAGGWKTIHGGGGVDGYLVKLSPEGAHLWSTYIGSVGADGGSDVAVDPDGRVYVTGGTDSSGWVSGGWDTHPGGQDGYVVKFSPEGGHLWSSFVGGAGSEQANSLSVDGVGNVFVGGVTTTPGWAVGGWDDTYGDGPDGFVAKIIQRAPAAPTSPGAMEPGLDAITWTWQDNSSDESGFAVWSDPGAVTPLTRRTVTAAGVTSWRQTGLTPNTQHTFQAAASSPYGASARSVEFSAWTLAAMPVAPVVNNAAAGTLDVMVGAGDGNPVETEYAMRCTTTGLWVQGDGSLGAAPVWRSAAGWGVVTVTGLAEFASYAFAVTARNGGGVETAPGIESTGMTQDATPPFGALSINGGAGRTNSTSATLALAYGDGAGSGAAQMRFSNDNTVWSDWEPVAEVKTWLLTPGDGPKTVHARFRDAAGNVSMADISGGIILDTQPPAAVITLAGPAATAADVVVFNLAVSEDLSPAVDGAGLTRLGTLPGVVSVAGAPPNLTVTVALSNPDDDGTVGIEIPAGVFADLAGNLLPGVSSPLCSIHNWPGFTGASGPSTAMLYSGGSHRLGVEVDTGGVAATYQWRCERGGKLMVNGPATAHWLLENLGPQDTGVYWCEVVYDGGAMHASDPVSLMVADHVRIVTPPRGGAFKKGESHTFSVAAEGGHGTLGYEWMKGGVALPEASGASHVIPDLKESDSGEYSVRVTDSQGDEAVSGAVTLVVDDAPPQGVPAARVPGLIMLVVAAALGGVWLLRRK